LKKSGTTPTSLTVGVPIKCADKRQYIYMMILVIIFEVDVFEISFENGIDTLCFKGVLHLVADLESLVDERLGQGWRARV